MSFNWRSPETLKENQYSLDYCLKGILWNANYYLNYFKINNRLFCIDFIVLLLTNVFQYINYENNYREELT